MPGRGRACSLLSLSLEEEEAAEEIMVETAEEDDVANTQWEREWRSEDSHRRGRLLAAHHTDFTGQKPE